MGSIPLPALNVQPVQQPDLLESYGRVISLRNAMQEQQIRAQQAPYQQQALQQQVQSGGLDIQQKQIALKNRQALTDAYSKWDGKSYEALAHLALQSGADGEVIQGIQKHALDVRKTIGEIAASDATTGSKHAETLLKQYDMASGALGNVLNASDDQMPQMLLQTVQALAQERRPDGTPLIDQQHQQLAQSLAQQGPDAIKKALPLFRKDLMATSQILDEAKTNAQIANEKATRDQAAATLANTQANQAATHKQEQQRINIEAERLNFDKARQGTQDQQAIETQAQQIATGDVKALSQARNNPYARAVMQRVYEINPKYSDSLYTMNQQLRSDKPNSMGANVTRLGTAILHGDAALNNSARLGFSEGLLTGVSTAASAAYKQDAEFLTGEVGQFVTGGKLTVDEGKKISSDLMSSRQSVRDSAIKQVIDLSGGKLKAQMEQFKNATQNEFPTDRVFNDPEIKGALQKHGVLSGSALPAGGQQGGRRSSDPFAQFGGKAH